MSSTKLLSVLLAVVAVSALALGSAGFSSVSADRSLSVSVADNEEAYVGVAACELGASNSASETTPTETTSTETETTATETDTDSAESATSPSRVRLWVGNNFSSPFTVQRISADGIDREPDVDLDPGELTRFGPFDDVDSMVVYVESVDGSFSAEVTVDIVSKDACPFERQAGEPANS